MCQSEQGWGAVVTELSTFSCDHVSSLFECVFALGALGEPVSEFVSLLSAEVMNVSRGEANDF